MKRENKNDLIKIGDKVWIVENDFSIAEKNIIEISDAMDKEGNSVIKYKLNVHSCGGVTRDKFFTKRSLAEVYVKKLTNDLKYKIGDIVIVKEMTSYNRTRRTLLGRIKNYVNDLKAPYHIIYLGGSYSYNSSDTFPEKDIIKIKDEYIENFEDITDLQKELKNLEEEYNKKYNELQERYEKLSNDIKYKFKKSSSIFLSKKRKLEYKDIFVDNRRDDG